MTDVASADFSPLRLLRRAGFALVVAVFACPFALYMIWRNLVWRLLDLDVRWSTDARAAVAVILEIVGSVVLFVGWTVLLAAVAVKYLA